MAVSGDRTEGSGIQNTPLRCAVGRWATLGLPAAPGRTQTSAAAPLASSVVVGVGRIKRVATAAAGLGRVVMLRRRDQGAAGTAIAVAGDQALQLRLRPAAPNPVGLSSTDRVGQADGVLVKVTVSERAGRLRVREVRYMPTWVEHPSFRIRPVLTALADRSLPAATRRALQAARDRTRRAVGPTARPAPIR